MKMNVKVFDILKSLLMILLALYFFGIPQYFGVPRSISLIGLIGLLIYQMHLCYTNKHKDMLSKIDAIFTVLLFVLVCYIFMFEVIPMSLG